MKKMSFRRLASLALIILLTASLMACGPSGQTKTLGTEAVAKVFQTDAPVAHTTKSADSLKIPSIVVATESEVQKTSTSSKTQTVKTTVTEALQEIYAAYEEVNVRSGPDTAFDIVTVLPAEAELVRTGVDSDNWIPVAAAGITGFIREDLVYFKEAVSSSKADAVKTKTYAVQGLVDTEAEPVSADIEMVAEAPPAYEEAPVVYEEEPVVYEEPVSQIVYITTEGEKYHQGWCRHLSQSKIEITLENAINRGFGACQNCH